MAYYCIISAYVLSNKSLTDFEKILYGHIVALSNKSGYCFATNKYFTQQCQKNIRTIQRGIDNLEKNGLIYTETIDNKRILHVLEESTERQKCHPPMTKMSPPHDKNVTPPKSISPVTEQAKPLKKSSNNTYNNTYNNIKEKTNINQNKNDIYKATKKPRNQSEQFSIFWNAYDKKVGKTKAIYYWNKINPDTEEFKRIIQAAKYYNQSHEPKYRLHPERWLRDKRFLDEVPIKSDKSNFISF